MNKTLSSQTLTWLVVLFLVPMPMVLSLSLQVSTLYLGNSLPIQLGVVAYAWMLAAVYLATRPHWLDRLVGLPHLYIIHGSIALLAIVAAFAHKELTTSSGLIKQTGDLSLILLIALGCWSMVFMAGWLTSRIKILADIKAFVERLAHHELSVWLHRLNLVAVILIFIHVQLISYISVLSWFMAIFDTMTFAVLLAYVIEKIRVRASSFSGTLTSNLEIAPSVHQLQIKLNMPQDMTWQAGDFAFLRFPDNSGMNEYHPFSIVNAPRRVSRSHSRTQPRTWVFAIRRDGDFTRSLSFVAPGARVEALPPFGRFQRFIEEHGPDIPIVIIAGGIGVTPMVSLAERFDNRIRVFVYTARRGSLLPYADDLRRRMSANGATTIIQDRRLTVRQMNAVLVRRAIYLVAGPAGMQRAWIGFLHDNQVTADRIYCEPFAW